MLLTKLDEIFIGLKRQFWFHLDKLKRQTLYRNVNHGVAYSREWVAPSLNTDISRFISSSDYPTETGFLKVGIIGVPGLFFYVVQQHLSSEKYPMVAAIAKPWSSMEGLAIEFIHDTLSTPNVLMLVAAVPADDPVLTKISQRMPGVMARNFS